jgi:hypothetical protein
VSGYSWAAAELGPIFGGLASACVFLAIAACSLAVAASSRTQARNRAALERAHRTQGASSLINPKTLQMLVQTGRHIGWQRFIAIALLGFLGTQFAREQTRRENDQ